MLVGSSSIVVVVASIGSNEQVMIVQPLRHSYILNGWTKDARGGTLVNAAAMLVEHDQQA
jgi:hypothetical protein